MVRLSHTWLRLMLAFVLAAMPFAQVMGDTGGYTSPGAGYGATMPDVGHMHMDHFGADGNACDNCDTAAQTCDGTHCGTCTATILQAALTIDVVRFSSLVPSGEPSPLAHHPFLLFRPPRA